MASKNDIVAKRSTFWSGAFIALWTVLMIFIGTVGAYLYPQFANNDQVLLNIASIHFPGILYGIFIIAMIGVVMSSQDTFLNNAGVSFAQDILPRIKPAISETQKLFYSKAYTIFIGLVAIGIASFVDSALALVIIILDYYTNILLVVTLFAILKNQHYWQSAVLSMLAGFLLKLGWDSFGNELIPSIVVGLSASLIAYLGSDFITIGKKRNNWFIKKLDKMLSRK